MYNILICDDEKDIVNALKIYLNDSNYTLFTAYDGREALGIVEKNEIHSSLAKKVVYEQLKGFKGKVSTLILGCTHYPLLRPIIQNALGSEVTLIDSGAECVRDISVLLNYFELNRDRLTEAPVHHYYTTGDAAAFATLAQTWLEEEVFVEHVEL